MKINKNKYCEDIQKPNLVNHNWTFFTCRPFISILPILSYISLLLTILAKSSLNSKTSPVIFLTIVTFLLPPILKSEYTGNPPLWLLDIWKGRFSIGPNGSLT